MTKKYVPYNLEDFLASMTPEERKEFDREYVVLLKDELRLAKKHGTKKDVEEMEKYMEKICKKM
jgi:hypothetical protein